MTPKPTLRDHPTIRIRMRPGDAFGDIWSPSNAKLTRALTVPPFVQDNPLHPTLRLKSEAVEEQGPAAGWGHASERKKMHAKGRPRGGVHKPLGEKPHL